MSLMPAGIRTSTMTDSLPSADTAPSSDRTFPDQTSRLPAPDRNPRDNAWCPGSPRESRAHLASCDRQQPSLGSAPLTGLRRDPIFSALEGVSPMYMRHWLYTTSPATIRPMDGTCREVVSALNAAASGGCNEFYLSSIIPARLLDEGIGNAVVREVADSETHLWRK